MFLEVRIVGNDGLFCEAQPPF